MAISESKIKEAVKAAFEGEKEKTDDQSGSIDRISGAIAKVVAAQIQEGINSAVITPVLTAPAGGGPVGGTITIEAVAEGGT